MENKEHIIGIRVTAAELKGIQIQVSRERLKSKTALVRKALFWYLDFMNKPTSK